MTKFMLILGGADVDKRSGNPAFAPIMARYEAWVKKLTDTKRLVGASKLKDQVGIRLTVRGGEVVDGPFIETKEAIGGIFIIEAASLEEATELARDCPALLLQNGYVEVRAVER
jgi:hypothetical protein